MESWRSDDGAIQLDFATFEDVFDLEGALPDFEPYYDEQENIDPLNDYISPEKKGKKKIDKKPGLSDSSVRKKTDANNTMPIKKTQLEPIDEGEEMADFTKWVSKNKKLSMLSSSLPYNKARALKRVASPHLATRIAQERMEKEKLAKIPGNSAFILIKCVASPRGSKSNGWDSRLAVNSRIPDYNAMRDRHCRVTKTPKFKTMIQKREKSAPPANAAIRPISPANPAKSLQGKQGVFKTPSDRLAEVKSAPASMASPRQRAAWEKENEEKEVATLALEKKIRRLESQISKQKKLLETKEQLIKKSEEVTEENTNKITKFQDHIKSLRKEKKLLEESAVSMRQELFIARTSANDDYGEDSNLQIQNQQLTQQVQQLLIQLNTRDSISLPLDADAGELSRLRKKIRIQQDKMNEMTDKLSEFNKYPKKMEKLKLYLERDREGSKKLTERITKLEKTNATLEEQIKQVEMERQNIDYARKNTQEDHSRIQEALQIERKRSRSEMDQSQEMTVKLRDAHKRLIEQEKLKHAMNKTVEEDKQNIRRITQKLASLEKDKTDLEEKNKQLTKELGAMSNSKELDYKSLRKELTEREKQVEQAQATIKTLQQEVQDAERQKEENVLKHSQTKSSHVKQLELVRSQLDTATEVKSDALKRLEKSNTTITSLTKELEQLKAERKQNEVPTSVISEWEKRVMDLTRRLTESEERCTVLSESNGLLLVRLKRIEENNR
jgi:chromosome segregation ATPase